MNDPKKQFNQKKSELAKRKTNHHYAIRNSKNLLDKRARLEEVGGDFHK